MLLRVVLGVVLLGGCSRSAIDGQPLGPSGGVRERDGARVDVPAGALTTEQLIAVARVSSFPAPPAGTRFSNGVFELTPHGQEFQVPVTVQVPASQGEVLLTASLGGTWRPVEGAAFANGELTGTVTHFSFFAAASSTVNAPKVFFSDGAALRAMNPDGSGLATLAPGVLLDQYLTGVAVDRVARQVYWSDSLTDRISRVGYDGTGTKVLVTGVNPAGIAIDGARGKMFWAEGANVRSANLDGTQVAVVIAGQAPTSVALDSAAQRLYWTDSGTDSINRVDYGGTNAMVLSTALDPASNPRGLAIDVDNGRLFWGEGANVRSCALDGTQATTLVAGIPGTNAPGAVAVDTRRRLLYWTDTGTDAAHTAPYSGASPRVLFQNSDRFANPQGIAVEPGEP